MSEGSASALEARNALVEQHRRLAAAIAASFHRRFPSRFELDDLVQIGVLALLGAAARYDPGRGASFATYARHRIRGAILNALGGAGPDPGGDGEDIPDSSAPSIEDLIELGEQRQALKAAIERLPPRQASVIKLRYGEGLTQAAAGERLGGISQAGARELELRAIGRLRRSLRPAA